MKTFLILLAASLGLSAHAGILAGPVLNPANGHTYYLTSQNTWSNAEAIAVSLGGHLAAIRNDAEEQWIFSTFGSYGGSLWIGLTDREKVYSFHWMTDEALSYTNWETDEPDNGTGGEEYYVHIWPPGNRSPGKWNDYLNLDNIFGTPLYGIVEVSQTFTQHLSLQSSSDTGQSGPLIPTGLAATTGPKIQASTAIELSWATETNQIYRIQWTPSLESPQWQNLDPVVVGTGTNISVFDSAKDHPKGFYRVQIVQ